MADPEEKIDTILNSVIPEEQEQTDDESTKHAYSGSSDPSESEDSNITSLSSEEFTVEFMRFQNPTYHLTYSGVTKTFCGRDLSGVNYKSTTTKPELLDPCQSCQRVRNQLSEEEQLENLRSKLANSVTGLSTTVDTPNSFEKEDLESVMTALPVDFTKIKGDQSELREQLSRALRTVDPNTSDPGYFTKPEVEAILDVMEGNHEEVIPKKAGVYLYTDKGRLKRTDLVDYHTQRRGGKGVIAIDRVEQERLKKVFVANTRSDLLVFTNRGLIHQLPAHQIPTTGREDEAAFPHTWFNLDPKERIQAILPVENVPKEGYINLVTQNGFIKRTHISAFENIHSGGIRAIELEPEDIIADVSLTNGSNDILLGTKNGRTIRFEENEIRAMGRSARGLRGIQLESGDSVVGMTAVPSDYEGDILTVKSNGIGKRTELSAYRPQSRDGKGIKNIVTGENTGSVVDITCVDKNIDLLVTSAFGKLIRISVDDISHLKRNTKGVAIMDLDNEDEVTGFATTPGRN